MRNLKDFEKGFSRYCVTKDGEVYSLISNRFLKKILNKDGYYTVCMQGDDDKEYTRRIHRLVAFMYCDGYYSNDLVVNHKDGDKINNHYTNLEWCTVTDNNLHAFEIGLSHCKNRAYTDEQIINVCRLLQDGLRPTDISKMTGVLRETVSAVKAHKSYLDISSDFDFSRQKREQRSDVERVIKICEMIIEGYRDYEIVKELDVPRKTVSNIRHRKTFTAISQNYEW